VKIAVVGSRNFNDYDLLSEVLFSSVSPNEDTLISGGAKGADSLAEQFAKENEIDCKIFEAEWDKFGKSAGFLRNEQIVEEAEHVIAFWDGKSKGTLNTINKAKKKGINPLVIYFRDSP
jgi:hypothetical protein